MNVYIVSTKKKKKSISVSKKNKNINSVSKQGKETCTNQIAFLLPGIQVQNAICYGKLNIRLRTNLEEMHI